MQLNDEDSSQPEVKKDQAEEKEEEQTSSDTDILVSPSTGSNLSESAEKPSTFFKRFWEWSGFGKKTLFEILQFLAILTPIIIFVAGQQANDRVRQETDKKEAEVRADTNRQQIFSNYLSLMKELLLERDLRQDKVNSVANAQTLSTLWQLDGKRRGEVIRFLYEVNLIGRCEMDRKTGEGIECQKTSLALSRARLDRLTFDSPIPLLGIDLSEVSMSEASLQGIDLTNAKLEGANLSGANLTGASLGKAQMQKTFLEGTNLTNAILSRANLEFSHLSNANLSGAGLRGANLSGAYLRGADLRNAYLQGADLRDANFEGADLRDTHFDGATYSSKTIFPEGFKPDKRRMCMDEQGMCLSR